MSAMKKAVLTLSQRRYGSDVARTEEPTRLPAQSTRSPRTPRSPRAKSLTGGINARKKTSLTRQPRPPMDPAEQDDCNIHKPFPTEFTTGHAPEWYKKLQPKGQKPRPVTHHKGLAL